MWLRDTRPRQIPLALPTPRTPLLPNFRAAGHTSATRYPRSACSRTCAKTVLVSRQDIGWIRSCRAEASLTRLPDDSFLFEFLRLNVYSCAGPVARELYPKLVIYTAIGKGKHEPAYQNIVCFVPAGGRSR